MNQLFEIGEWVIEVDTEATSLKYLDIEDCKCVYCRNARAAHKYLPKELTDLLFDLGLNPKKPLYTIEYYKNSDGMFVYSLFFDVVGRLVSGIDLRAEKLNNVSNPHERRLFPEVDVAVAIWKEPYVPGHFTQPAIELEFSACLPWVLEDEDEPIE